MSTGRTFTKQGYCIELQYKNGPVIITEGWQPGNTHPHIFPSQKKALAEARYYRKMSCRVVIRRVTATTTVGEVVK